jgi:hypothetical protein
MRTGLRLPKFWRISWPLAEAVGEDGIKSAIPSMNQSEGRELVPYERYSAAARSIIATAPAKFATSALGKP